MSLEVNIRKSFPSFALDVEFQASDETLGFLGASGCGKSLTMRCIAGIETPDEGRIVVNGKVFYDSERKINLKPQERKTALLFQNYMLFPNFTAAENVGAGIGRDVPKAERRSIVEAELKRFGLESFANRFPAQLSGGQQQRVALARMLAVNPGVLLLDEPLSNLDARLRLEMRAELKRLHAAFRTTIVFVTHDQWEAMTLATSIAVMSEGRLQQLGTPNDIYDRPANRFVAEFVGSPPINILETATGHALDRAASHWLAGRLGESAGVGSLGVRPEALQIARSEAAVPGGSFRHAADVTGILPTGGSWIIELKVDGRALFATTTESPVLKGGERVFVHARPTAMHVFDDNGNRISAADEVLARAA